MVGEAENGQVALDKSVDAVPNVVLLGWKMPMMSGIEYLIAIPLTEEGNKPVTVFCTAETIPSTFRKALSPGGTNTS